MSYTNLENIRIINGLPADMHVIQKLIDNDQHFNNEINNDDDLGSLNRSIVPTSTDFISLGSIVSKFKELFTGKVHSSHLLLKTEGLEKPSIEMNDIRLEASGLGKLSFAQDQGPEFLNLESSGLTIKTESSSQLKLESVTPGDEAIWTLGGNSYGFKLTGFTEILSLNESQASILKPLEVTINGQPKIKIDENETILNTQSILINTTASIGESNKPKFLIKESIGYEAITLPGEITNEEIDVTNISKLLIDNTSGSVSLKGFTGGQEGQILYIVKLNNLNNFSISHNDITAMQPVLLKGSTAFEITNDYGGIVLSFDQGMWREISRS
ncbi:MAG: hypothetical protein PHY47_00240 [Lachnospiraceae bacterium]|nr:hypothetical protein [Lachnospiraceae bacterium]